MLQLQLLGSTDGRVGSKIMVFSTMGMLMKTVAVEAGETASVSDLPSGIYIVNNKKRVCHKSMAHPFRFFSFFQIRN